MFQSKVLLIGFGSIGQKHYKILKDLINIKNIKILTSQKKIKNVLINFEDIKLYNPDIIIIASTTDKHFQHLKYVNSILKNKIILVEKPLFHKPLNLKKIQNKIFVGYNLRFHPIIQFVKKIINKNKILSSEIHCSSYLPDWRNRPLKFTSSYSKKLSGGILNELSHEIDYACYLYGNLSKINVLTKKNSNLNINSADYANINLKSLDGAMININLNYYSKLTKRFIILDTNKLSLYADLINGFVSIKNNNGKTSKKLFLIDKDFTYKEQLKALLRKDFRLLCQYKDGLETVKKIKIFMKK